MKIFIAGPLFSQAEREFNLKLDRFLRDHKFETFLPQRDAGELKQAKKAQTIYEADLRALEHADVVIAVFDGQNVDSGTAFEIGYANAKEACDRAQNRRSNFR